MTTSAPATTETQSDPFENLVKLLSELPTEKAMQEVAKGKIMAPAARQVVETMALHKSEILRLMKMIKLTERIAVRQHNAAMTMLKLSAGIDATAAQLEKLGFTWDSEIEIKPAHAS